VVTFQSGFDRKDLLVKLLFLVTLLPGVFALEVFSLGWQFTHDAPLLAFLALGPVRNFILLVFEEDFARSTLGLFYLFRELLTHPLFGLLKLLL
jgi:hypothetical protein